MPAYFEAEPSAADPAKDHRPESRNGHEDRAGRSDPVVEHAHETDVSTEVLEIGSYLQQCGSAGAEQNVIDDFLVEEREVRKLVLQREDDMHVGNIQQFGLAGGKPLEHQSH